MHPSEIIAETLENMNVSLRQFAKSMEIDPSIASKLLSGHRFVTLEMALRLSIVITVLIFLYAIMAYNLV
ncbi:hypothetical protein XBFM1_1190033 [Xenorhabdus bovienii str. feltiae Moldova]|uniref:Uncharacterized protein n=1 Tax=Xenorhabdus bovienii str. feltiae Moldova TaxID=1398200 RepID=A0A077NN18_XENBV|nr:hypothetical protein XBFM1_1190033 [Xenorhabdus bovienii str. feltiae Moldova]